MTAIAEATRDMQEKNAGTPTIFEVETVLAFLYFKEKKCDIVVLETGMGGLLDATNIIETTVLEVLASISMDHMEFLGDTLGKIAEQKAGIIKPQYERGIGKAGAGGGSSDQKCLSEAGLQPAVCRSGADYRCAVRDCASVLLL